MLIEDINPYLALAVVGACSGLGSALGQWVFSISIKPGLESIHKRIKKKTQDDSEKRC